MCRKEVGPLQLQWQALQFPLLLHFVETPQGQAAFFSVHAECDWVHTISPDMAFILESFNEYLKLPWQGQNLTCLSSLQLLLLNSYGLTHCHRSEKVGTCLFLHNLSQTQARFLYLFLQLKPCVLQSSLSKQRPLKVFSFRTQGSHLLWNLIDGLFINFLSSKFLLQRKRWHTKSSVGMGGGGWNACLWTQQQLENPYNSEMRKLANHLTGPLCASDSHRIQRIYTEAHRCVISSVLLMT